MIQPGQQAPDFTRTTHTGESVRLSQYQDDKAVVLYFYPKDETPGCTAEACTFRDNYEDNMATFIKDIRSTYKVADLPFVIGVMGTGITEEKVGQNAVSLAQRAAAARPDRTSNS